MDLRGRPRRLKSFFLQTRNGGPGGACVPGKALLGFSPHFSLILLNPEGNRDGMRRRIKFWIERLIINLARELSFSGTQFHHN